MNDLINNLHKLHTTEMGVQRIIRNLNIVTDDVVGWCRCKIIEADITQNGKNWYAAVNDIVITVNAHSYTIITAHKKKTTNRR